MSDGSSGEDAGRPTDADGDAGDDDAGSIPLDELARELDDTDEDPGGDLPPEVDAVDLDATGAEGDAAPAAGEDAPLGDLAADVRDRQAAAAETADDDAELFEEVGVGEVDTESVWEALESDPEEGGDEEITDVGVGAEAERVDRDDPGAVRPDHVVPKREFCQRCEFFSEPPAVACGNEGTDIVEVTDPDHFRVRGCPKVDGDGGGV